MAQREITEETSFQEEFRPEIAERRGIATITHDNPRKAACRELLRASRKKEERSSSRGDRSKFECNRSNFECAASNSRRDA